MKPGDKVLIRAVVSEPGLTRALLMVRDGGPVWTSYDEIVLEPNGTDETAVALAAAQAEIRELKERLQEATKAYHQLALQVTMPGWSIV